MTREGAAGKLLVTGNLGYVGPLVVERLRAARPETRLVGFDAGYFAGCLTAAGEPPGKPDEQLLGDVRRPPEGLLRGVAAVVHLAAVSNDPMGQAFEAVTGEINEAATVDLARRAKQAGAGSFVFASSCSVYGFSQKPCAEDSPVNPLTAYARSKVGAERALEALASPSFRVRCLRFATACGMSPRLRLDLVLNDFAASALALGRIDILSDGTPWRPLIDVRDMARAVEWAAGEASGTEPFLRVNVGRESANYRMKELAEAVARLVPAQVSVNSKAQPDRRSYAVDFSLYRRLAPEHQPACSLEETIAGLRDGLRAIGFADKDFRRSGLMRLNVLRRLREEGRLDEALRWKTQGEPAR